MVKCYLVTFFNVEIRSKILEFLLSQLEDPSKSLRDHENSGIDIYVGCDSGFREVSTVTGTILRTR